MDSSHLNTYCLRKVVQKYKSETSSYSLHNLDSFADWPLVNAFYWLARPVLVLQLRGARNVSNSSAAFALVIFNLIIIETQHGWRGIANHSLEKETANWTKYCRGFRSSIRRKSWAEKAGFSKTFGPAFSSRKYVSAVWVIHDPLIVWHVQWGLNPSLTWSFINCTRKNIVISWNYVTSISADPAVTRTDREHYRSCNWTIHPTAQIHHIRHYRPTNRPSSLCILITMRLFLVRISWHWTIPYCWPIIRMKWMTR